MAQSLGRTMKSQHSSIFGLPRELRDSIYHFALLGSGGVFFFDPLLIQLTYSDEIARRTPGLTWEWAYVCKQVFVEAKEQCSRGGIIATKIVIWPPNDFNEHPRLHALRLQRWSVFDPKHICTLSMPLLVRHRCDWSPPLHQWYGLARSETISLYTIPFMALSGISIKHLRFRIEFWSRLSWSTRGVDLSALESWNTTFESVSFILEQPIVRNADLFQHGQRCVLRSLAEDYLDCQEKLLKIALNLTGARTDAEHDGQRICDWIGKKEAAPYEDPEYLWHLDVQRKPKRCSDPPKLIHPGLQAFSHLLKLGKNHDIEWSTTVGGKFTFKSVGNTMSDSRAYYCRSKDDFLMVENDRVWVIQGRPDEGKVVLNSC